MEHAVLKSKNITRCTWDREKNEKKARYAISFWTAKKPRGGKRPINNVENVSLADRRLTVKFLYEVNKLLIINS